MSTSRRGFLGSLLLAPFFGKLLPRKPVPLLSVDESKALPTEVGYYFARYECFPRPLSLQSPVAAVIFRDPTKPQSGTGDWRWVDGRV